jgi:hypothetical protein
MDMVQVNPVLVRYFICKEFANCPVSHSSKDHAICGGTELTSGIGKAFSPCYAGHSGNYSRISGSRQSAIRRSIRSDRTGTIVRISTLRLS